MTDLILYGHPDSGHACKVALALSLAGLPHRTRWVDMWAPAGTRPPEFLANSPFAEVPLLTIDGRPFVQSGAILLEIAERFQCLGGETADGLQRARELMMWEANRIGMCLPQLKEARRVKGVGYPPGAIEWLTGRWMVDRDRFGIWLAGAPFLHGDRPGVGDCAIWGYVQWLPEAGVEPTAEMADWIARMRRLPGMRPPQAFFPNS
jgi:glutathione S-transferase